MGKGEHIAISIAEGIFNTLFSITRIIVLLIVRLTRTHNQTIYPPIKDHILRQTAITLAQKIRKRELKSEDIVKSYISRLKEVHELYNIVTHDRYDDALEEARRIDDLLASTDKTEADLEKNVPILGVPFTVKGSIAVKGLPHTSGLLSRKNTVADDDAVVVSLLRDAGGIPIAITNIPEVCCWWETYNSMNGRTKNPYNINRTAGGSSGGEGAAIASAGSLIGLGSDFGGSIRIPAAFNGVFGHRPSSLTVSIDGHYPIPPEKEVMRHLVTGPMTRYAKDLRLILKIMTRELAPDLQLDVPVDVRKVKIYYMLDITGNFLMTPVETAIKASIKKAALHFKTIGSHVEAVQLPNMKYAMIYWYAVMKMKRTQMGRVASNNEGDINFLWELMKCLFGRSEHTLPISLFGLLEAGNGVPYKGRVHVAFLNMFEKLRMDLQTLLGDNAVLIMPTHPTAALHHREALARTFDIGYSAVFNVLDMPATHCPTGFNEKNVPIGVQVVANHKQDRLTLAVAEEIERAFGGWRPLHDNN